MLNNLKNRNMFYSGHIMRNTSGHCDTLLRTIDGRRESNEEEGVQDEHGSTI